MENNEKEEKKVKDETVKKIENGLEEGEMGMGKEQEKRENGVKK